MLRPGDVLYVPRGVLHSTTMPTLEPGGAGGGGADFPAGTSMHLTVGMEFKAEDMNPGARWGWPAERRNLWVSCGGVESQRKLWCTVDS